MALTSTPVLSSDPARASQYNALRTDLIGHTHDGADTSGVSLANNQFLQGKDNTGVNQNLIGLDAANIVQVGGGLPVRVAGPLTAAGPLAVGGGLTVTGPTVLNNTVQVGGGLTLASGPGGPGSLSVSGPSVVNNTLTVYGFLTAAAGLTVGSATGFSVTGGPSVFSGTVMIGDNTNAQSTLGLTINQGAADNEILSLKSSDVAHGVTSLTETDTYFYVAKLQNDGGVRLVGLAGTSVAAVQLVAVGSTSDYILKDTSALAPLYTQSWKKSGAGNAAPGANANIVAFASGASTKIIFDAEGDAHQDGTGWTAYDAADDLALCDALDATLDPALRTSHQPSWLAEHEALVEGARLVHFNRDTDGVPFVNTSRLGMLHNGALRRALGALAEQQGRVAALETRLAQAGI